MLYIKEKKSNSFVIVRKVKNIVPDQTKLYVHHVTPLVLDYHDYIDRASFQEYLLCGPRHTNAHDYLQGVRDSQRQTGNP